MKTIDDLVNEIKRSPVYKSGDEYLVKAGWDLAHLWIPVEEDAPMGLVLMKLSNGEIRLGNFLSKMLSSNGIFVNVTHWRPI